MSVMFHASKPAAPQVGDAYFDNATQETKFYNGVKWMTMSYQVPAVPLYEPPKPKLSVELVPESAWWSNVRSNISKKDWEKCKAFVRERSGGKCEICGGVGPKHPVECHEIWVYDYELTGDSRGTQTLVDLIALCPDCHRVKHIGRTAKVGGLAAMDRSIQHLCKVNGWTPDVAEQYLETAFAVHEMRSRMTWELNIDYLSMLNIEPEVKDRP